MKQIAIILLALVIFAQIEGKSFSQFYYENEQNYVANVDDYDNVVINQKFDQEVLDKHNEYRAIHQVPLLQIDTELSKHAQMWAEKMVRENFWAHSPVTLKNGTRIGENISKCNKHTGAYHSKLFYDEYQFYDYATGKHKPDFLHEKIGHLTQLLWKETKFVGSGKAYWNNSQWMMVSNYYPPGNYFGKEVANVPRTFNLKNYSK